MKKIMPHILAGLFALSWGSAYAEIEDGIGKNFGGNTSSGKSAQMPPNHPPMGNSGAMQKPSMPMNMMAPEGPVAQGKVLDVTSGAGYSYLLLESGGKQFWIAGTQVQAAKGDVVSYIENVVMENFHSKSLNKTFERIVFASSVKVVP